VRFKTILSLLLLAFPCMAQESANYTLEESTFNAGGNPGEVLASANYTITMGTLGDAIAAGALYSASYAADSGFGACYQPAGEVTDLRFAGATTLEWNPEPSIGTYTLHRGVLTNLPGSYGLPLLTGLTDETASDGTAPSSGQTFFYLVTASNRLDEPGTKGTDSSGEERP